MSAKQQVAKAQEHLPAEDLSDLLHQDAGRGSSQDQSDKFYPLLTVLHALSPQCDVDSPAYVDGAKAGSIWLRNYDPPIVDGKTGILVQPVKMYKEWVEWVPRDAGGGMVGRYLKRPESAVCRDVATNRWVLGEHELRETRMWVVNYFNPGPVAFIIPCQSTMNTFARQWNTVIEQQFEDGGRMSPTWRYLWRLTTKQRQNSMGKWHVLAFEKGEKIMDRDRAMAGHLLLKSVSEAIEQGLRLTETIGEETRPRDTGEDEEM